LSYRLPGTLKSNVEDRGWTVETLVITDGDLVSGMKLDEFGSHEPQVARLKPAGPKRPAVITVYHTLALRDLLGFRR
jgi:hypothetical protein